MKQLKLDTFLNYNYLSDLEVSPKGEHLSFIKAVANYDANNYNHTLYLFDEEKEEKLLDLKEDPRYYWENEESILYFQDEGEADKKLKELKHTSVYRFDLKAKESELAYQFKIPISNIEVLNDNELLITSSLNIDDHKLLNDDKKRQIYLNKLNDDDYFHIIDEVPFVSNGGGFIDSKRSQAFIYNIKDDTYTALINKDEDFGQYKLNQNKDSIYFTSAKALGIPNFYANINKYNIETKESKVLYDKKEVVISNVIPINDNLYVMASDQKDHGINQNPNFYTLKDNDLSFTKEFGLSAHNSIGSDARFGKYTQSRIIDDKYYFVGTTRNKTYLYVFDGKQISVAFSPQGSIDTFVNYKDTYYVIGFFRNNLQEIYRANFKTNKVKTLTTINKNVIKDTYISKPLCHRFENDGQPLDGWVLLPQDYDEDKTYPAILDIHGGPKTIFTEIFYHEMQAWANLGYIVFYTNPRGGDAYGDDFANIRGKYGSIDYDDIMAFTDLVLKEYSIDPDRLGVTGGSYGGFMTNWVVSHTDRFKAAATQRSISNWISFYGTSDIGSYFGPDQTDGHPLKDHDKVWEQSPLKHANNIKTPLLFIHSDQDYRCPIEQAMQLYSVVKMNGIDTRFAWFKDENHDLSRSGKPQARLKRLEEITNWMNKYLDN